MACKEMEANFKFCPLIITSMRSIFLIMEPASQPEKIKRLLAGGSVRSASEFTDAGVNPASLPRAVADGVAISYARGIYISGTEEFPNGVGYAAVSLINPGGVVCLSSAALIHRLSDENPWQIWYAVDRNKVKKPATGSRRDPVRTLYWQEPMMRVGVETITFGGVLVQVTSPARTVVDMLRYRSKFGDEPAMKAMKDFVVTGGDAHQLMEIAHEIGCFRQVEPFARLAEEIQSAIPRRSP
jgi:hypothetical protein